jgi:hypothetical protein
MKLSRDAIPVVLFAHARPVHLARALGCLQENRVPKLWVFADGARNAADAVAVAETRALLRRTNWCDITLIERASNLGLGHNVLSGVTEIAAQYDAFIVWEDDLICVPGTYDWMAAALRFYADNERVMSVTGWTHPRVAPAGQTKPYFDARPESWSWGAWSRSWRGMPEETALEKMAALQRRGIDPAVCGADLPLQAAAETSRNLWACRWAYHHLQHDGLCLRPPWSMVDHSGFDALATNAPESSGWHHAALRAEPPAPWPWPEPREERECRERWRAAYPQADWRTKVRRALGRLTRF